MKAAFALVAAVLAPGVAHADEPVPPRARALADRGRLLHERGDYGRAIAAFKDAYVLAPTPGLVFNLAQAYRLHGDCEDAALLYRRYLAADPEPERRALVEAHLATMVRCLEAGAPGSPQAPAPALTADVTVPAVGAGLRRKQVGIGVAIGGSLALAGAVFFSLEASDAEHAARTASAGQRLRFEERADSASSTAAALAIGGGLAAITGATLYVLGVRAERAAAVSITPAAAGTGLAMAWRF